jgi:hypothetical protein
MAANMTDDLLNGRPIEKNNAQFTYATKIISFAIKKWSYLSRTTFKRWIPVRICASHVGHNQSNGSKCVIDVCRTWPTFEKTDLGHVRQQSVTWEKDLIEHVINVKTLNGSEHDGRYVRNENYQFCNKKVIIFESHHVQKMNTGTHLCITCRS